MEFKNGMLGCLVIMLMMGCAVFGTILISGDESTYDVTKYRYETEVTGLFPVDSSPEYLDYDLSGNYTGYYTPDTIVGNVNYWGGATYDPSNNVNNYPVRYAPSNSVTGTATITSTNAANMANSSLVNGYTGITYYKKTYDGGYSYVTQSYTKTLTSVLSELGLTGYDNIEITSPVLSYPPTNQLFFGTTDDFGNNRPGNQSQIFAACYVEQEYYQSYPQNNIYSIACHSCKIDRITETVKLYYNNTTDNSAFVKTIPLNDALVSFSTINLTPSTGITFNTYEYNNSTIAYMNISKGVTVTGV